jgi:hypothetical protein
MIVSYFYVIKFSFKLNALDGICIVWLRLLFKVFFTWKYINIMFFCFFKIIFDISTSK